VRDWTTVTLLLFFLCRSSFLSLLFSPSLLLSFSFSFSNAVSSYWTRQVCSKSHPLDLVKTKGDASI